MAAGRIIRWPTKFSPQERAGRESRPKMNKVQRDVLMMGGLDRDLGFGSATERERETDRDGYPQASDQKRICPFLLSFFPSRFHGCCEMEIRDS